MDTAVSQTTKDWHFAQSLAELENAGTLLVRVQGKQIALFKTTDGVRACVNRCPHEGYPLSQGSLSNDCILTCNWHNWKFNLITGENLYGGDKLRTYPVEIRNDEIWVDISDPPFEERYDNIVTNLRDAFDDHSYDRIGREIARLKQLGADPFDTLRLAIKWSWQQMEFGWTHAYAGMADWLTLYDEAGDDEELKLVCLMESIGHAADDVLREETYLFTDKSMPFDETGFLNAIEIEDEITAVAMIRGGLNNGLRFENFERVLSHAALAHYNDFGHSLIYVTKAKVLIDRLGDEVAEPLLLSLVREMIYAAREDRIPEFRHYEDAVRKWGKGDMVPEARNWYKRGIDSALNVTIECSKAEPEIIYRELLLANAISMLSYDISQQSKVRIKVAGNVSWLDFTHGLTFANAVRKQCGTFPELWSRGLLQMACFTGRNATFTTESYDLDTWRLSNSDLKQLFDRLYDHGQDEYIVSVHLVKTALAVHEEMGGLPEEKSEILSAALNRFFNSPLKRKQTKRTAYQSIQFVEKE